MASSMIMIPQREEKRWSRLLSCSSRHLPLIIHHHLTARGQNLLIAKIVPSRCNIVPLVAFEDSKVLTDVSNDEVPCHFPIDADCHH